jgi:protein tyrosine/serine phosphatase
VHERGVQFQNVYNFRDLGGYQTVDGRSVRWGRLFRADDLSRLREADRQAFAKLDIRTVVDLRRPNEVDEDGRIPEFDGFDYHHVHMAHPTWQFRTFASTDERAEYVLERYKEMSVFAADAIGEALRLIADADHAPLVFHCIAGKDRTGIVAGVTLSLLGVDDATIADDYAMSELAEPPTWEYFSQFQPDLDKRWLRFTVSPRVCMLWFLDHLRAEHGSISNYAISVGLTQAHVDSMRVHLLTGR